MSAILIMEAVMKYVLIPMEATIVLVCNNSNCIKPHIICIFQRRQAEEHCVYIEMD